MDDQLRALQRLSGMRPNKAVRIGDHADSPALQRQAFFVYGQHSIDLA